MIFFTVIGANNLARITTTRTMLSLFLTIIGVSDIDFGDWCKIFSSSTIFFILAIVLFFLFSSPTISFILAIVHLLLFSSFFRGFNICKMLKS